MASSDASGRSAARIARLCDVATDTRLLRAQVVEELRRVVGFDSYAWLLTDPQTSVGTAPLADVPWLPELPRQIRLKYATAVNRWTGLDGSSVALLHESTGGDLAQSRVWRDLLREHGVVDVASTVFRDRFGCWGFLELWRSADPFRPADASFLAAQLPALTAALRRTQQACFVAHRPDAPVGPVVLLLSPELEVRGQTPQTERYLRTLVPPSQGHSPVPASAYNAAAQLLAVEEGVDDNPPWGRVHLADGVWVTVRAARIDGAGAAGDRDIAVTIEPTTTTERVDLFCRVHGLSPRETALLGHLVAGHDTREVAARMFVSENTVQDHLKSVFDKTAVRNRRTLLLRATGS